MPVLKPFTVPLGANGPLVGEETDLSVFVEMQLPDLPGMPQLEKKSEQMSVLQAINNNQQMLQALADQLHLAGKHRAVGSGHGTSLCLSTATASHLDPVFLRLHAKFISASGCQDDSCFEGRIGISILRGKFASLNNLFGVRKRIYYPSRQFADMHNH